MTATPGVVTIDARMHGLEHNLAAYFLPAERPTLVEPGPESSLDTVIDGLAALGVGPDDLAYVVVTHIHLDHAGGAGLLAQRFPNATVVVHAEGARHLHDPTRLLASASRIYGDSMTELWGSITPLAETRMRVVDEGDVVDLGGGRRLDVLYTPGHAKHHMCLIDSDTGGVFVGDSVGMTLPGSNLIHPLLPPPDIDPAQLVHQLLRLSERGVTSINFSHFGIDHDVDAVLDQAVRRVRRWDEIVAGAITEGLDAAGAAQRLATIAHADYVAEGFAHDVIAAAEERTDYVADAFGLWRAHTHTH